MKLASLNAGRDGRLVVVSGDLNHYTDAGLIAPSAALFPVSASTSAKPIARCHVRFNGRTGLPMSIMCNWCAKRGVPICPKAFGPTL
jgi:hypothetical protein